LEGAFSTFSEKNFKMSRNLGSSVDSSSSSTTTTTTTTNIDSIFLKSNEAEIFLQSQVKELQTSNGEVEGGGKEEKEVEVVEDILNTENDSVEDLLTTLMKQLKGSDWLKEAAIAAASTTTSTSVSNNFDGLMEIKEAVDIENGSFRGF